MPSRVLMAALLLTTLPGLAGAQAPPGSLPVTVGQRVWVSSDESGDVRGTVTAIDAAGLHVKTSTGSATILIDSVRLIEKRDSALNGVAIGGIVGAATGLLAAKSVGSQYHTSIRASDGAGVVITAAAMGAGLFGLIDALTPGRTVIYRRGVTRSVAVAPVVVPGAAGLTATVRWR